MHSAYVLQNGYSYTVSQLKFPPKPSSYSRLQDCLIFDPRGNLPPPTLSVYISAVHRPTLCSRTDPTSACSRSNSQMESFWLCVNHLPFHRVDHKQSQSVYSHGLTSELSQYGQGCQSLRCGLDDWCVHVGELQQFSTSRLLSSSSGTPDKETPGFGCPFVHQSVRTASDHTVWIDSPLLYGWSNFFIANCVFTTPLRSKIYDAWQTLSLLAPKITGSILYKTLKSSFVHRKYVCPSWKRRQSSALRLGSTPKWRILSLPSTGYQYVRKLGSTPRTRNSSLALALYMLLLI